MKVSEINDISVCKQMTSFDKTFTLMKCRLLILDFKINTVFPVFMEYFSQNANSEESKLMKKQCDIFVVLILLFPSFVTRFSGYQSGRGGRQDLTEVLGDE